MKILLAIFAILFVSIVSAQQGSLGTFQQNTCVSLIQTCDGACTFNNITSVIYPNSTQAIGSKVMTKIGNQFNYTFCSTSQNGQYLVNGLGDDGGVVDNWVYDFTINGVGQPLATGQSILYLLVFAIAFILFIITLFIGISLPYDNNRDAVTGYILAVSNIKYFKIFCLCICYLMLMLMCYFGWIISYSYLDFDFLGNLMKIAFYSSVVLILPLGIVGFYLIIANIVRDAKISEQLEGGFRVS